MYPTEARYIRDAILDIAMLYDGQAYDGPMLFEEDMKAAKVFILEMMDYVAPENIAGLFLAPREDLEHDGNFFLDTLLNDMLAFTGK